MRYRIEIEFTSQPRFENTLKTQLEEIADFLHEEAGLEDVVGCLYRITSKGGSLQ